MDRIGIGRGQARRGGVRPSPVFLVFIVIAAGGGALAAVDSVSLRARGVGAFALVIGGWVVTLCLHEFAHAFGAHRAGDTSVEANGYLTLNPFRYAHPVLSILLPLFFIAQGGIGLPGGAVYLHPDPTRRRGVQSAIALAGPLTNAIFGMVILEVVRRFGLGSAHAALWAGLAFLGYLQISAALLNLIPLPGLDGYAAIEPYLSPQTARGFEPIKPFGLLIVFALLQVSRLNVWFFEIVYRLYDLTGADRYSAQVGNALLRFWNL